MKPQDYGFCVIRRPLLSRNILEDFNARISEEPGAFESELRRIFSDPILLEGLQLASGTLYDLTKDFVQGKSISGKQKLHDTLYKFLIRAASRCTPFGLFAGYFTVQTGESTQIRFYEQNPLKIRSRLDMSAKQAIRAQVLKNASVRSQLLFYPNSSLYHAGHGYRYMKRLVERQEASFILTQVGYDPVLEKILTEAEHGILPARIKSLLQGENLSTNSADAYAAALLSSQMVVDSLEPSVVGDDYLGRLKTKLISMENAKTFTAAVHKIQTQLKLNVSAEQVNISLKDFLQADHPRERTLQTTLSYRTTQARLSGRVLERLSAQLSRTAPLTRRVHNQDLDDFTSRFCARYAQQPVPLLLALDYDYGIGYGALSQSTQTALPLLSGLLNKIRSSEKRQDQANDIAGVLFQSLFENKTHTVLLTDALLKKYSNLPSAELPPEFYVLGSFHAASQQALDSGDFLFELKALSGPSATRLLSRFCPGDPGLTSHVSRIIRAQKARQDDFIFAEIAHLPSGQAANIVQRPDLGGYQIAYLARGAKEAEKTISAQDLWLSCADGKNLVLTSPILGKTIIPTLNSAHNFRAGLPVYRFLCDLANQQTASLHWDWGIYADAPFLPRVQYDQLILSKASWLLTNADEIKGTRSITEWWKEIKRKFNTPRYFTAGQDDQTLLIDSESEPALTLLRQMLKKEGSLRISESLEKPGQGILQQSGNQFSNEVVIPYYIQTRPATHAKELRTPPVCEPGSIVRHFNPGSAWLYVKIYCAERLCDFLITHTLTPLLTSLQKHRIIQKWFFIRYQDPQPHLRLRFYSEKKDFWVVVLKRLYALMDPLLQSGMVQSVQTDTYVRELERFLPPLYEKIESVFHRDSQAVFKALGAVQQDVELRWQAALLGTDLLLGDFGLNVNDRLLLIEKMHQQFAAELDCNGVLRRGMDQNYRAHKQLITTILGAERTPKLLKLTAFFEKRSIILTLLAKDGLLKDSLLQTALCTDVIHLFLNRWFFTHQRQQEFVVYHYLKKYYTSVMKNKRS